MLPLSTRDGLDLFDAALAASDPAVVAARFDLTALRRRAAEEDVPVLLRGLVRTPPRRVSTSAAPTGASLKSVWQGLSEPDLSQAAVDLVCAHVATVLAHSPDDVIREDKSFRDLGFESLTAVELRNRLNAVTGLRLPATVVFDHPTPRALADHLVESLVGRRQPVSAIDDMDIAGLVNLALGGGNS
jgi:acyl carrier protein